MKAILVIDMPQNCEECELGCYRFNTLDLKTLPNDCPLRPMPLKRETQVEWQGIGGVTTHEPSEYDKGWNDCVELLEGEYDG